MKEKLIIFLKSTCGMVTALAGVLVLLYIAFFGAVMNDSFLADVNLKIDIHEKLGMSEEDLIKVAQSMVYYTKGEVDTLQVRVTMHGEERDFYNERELLHIEDVRELVHEVRIFIIGCTFVFLAGVITLACSKDLVKLARGFLFVLGIVIVLAAVIAGVASVDMNAVVNAFHEIFFDNDLWQMNADRDMVVRLFSYDMYGSAIARIGIWMAALLVPFTVLSVVVLKRERNSVEKEYVKE